MGKPGLKKELSLLSAFFSVGVISQASSLLVGILIIRSLEKPEYAYYTLFFSLFSSLLQFTDLGVTSGAMGACGKRHEDRGAFSAAIATARRFRLLLMGVGCLPLCIWGYWLLHVENGAPNGLTFTLLASLLVLGYFGLEKSLFQLVPKIAGHHRYLFRAGLFLPAARLLLGLCLYLSVLNLTTALLLFAVSTLLEFGVYWRRARETIDLRAGPDPEVHGEIREVFRRQAINTGFFVFFSQISLWLISIFGSTENVAEVGALSRLSLAMAVLLPILDNLIYPRVSRSKGPGEMTRQAYYGFLLVLVFGAGLLLGVAFFHDWILMILGEAYTHLGAELMWVALAVVFQGGSTVWLQANAARGWVLRPVVRIPIRVSTLIVFIWMVDVSTVAGVLQLQVLSNAAGILNYAIFFHLNLWKMKRGEERKGP